MARRSDMKYFTSADATWVQSVDDFKYQFYQQPYGWPGEKVTTGENLNTLAGGYMNEF
jgi:hypothetical protein